MALKTTIQLRRDTLAKWNEINPVLAAGEIALVDKNNGVGSKKWVVRIGDGVTEFKNLPETDYVINEQLAPYALSADVASQVSELHTKIDEKISVDGENVGKLKIERIAADLYHDMVAAGTVSTDTIYIVSSDHLNAYNQNITNVKAGVEDTDAINLGQLKAVSADIDQKITDIVAGDMSAAIGTLSSEINARIDGLETEIDGVSATADAKFGEVSTQISGVDSKVETLSGEVKVIDEAVKTITETTIPELKTELSTGLTIAVGAGETDEAGDIKYTLTQGGKSVGDIVVPRDIFVETAVLGEDNKLILTLKDGTQIPVDLAKFIDTYTAKDSSTIDVTVENREISAEVIDGSIVEAKLGDKAVTTAKIADSAVTATQIADKTITMAKLSETDVFVFDCGGAE